MRETKNFSKTVASLFHITQKVWMAQALFFLNLNNATEQLKTLSVALIRINFCLLISLYLGRIVCLNLTLIKIKTYNFPLLLILYHRWAEIEHMTKTKNYNIVIINFGQKMTTLELTLIFLFFKSKIMLNLTLKMIK